MAKRIKQCLILTALTSSGLCAAASLPYPCLTMRNETATPLLVQNDPNWDDQQLLVNGKVSGALNYQLPKHKSIRICGLWSQFGLNIYPNNNFVAFTVLNDDGSNLTKISAIYPQSAFNYQIEAQTATQISIKVD